MRLWLVIFTSVLAALAAVLAYSRYVQNWERQAVRVGLSITSSVSSCRTLRSLLPDPERAKELTLEVKGLRELVAQARAVLNSKPFGCDGKPLSSLIMTAYDEIEKTQTELRLPGNAFAAAKQD